MRGDHPRGTENHSNKGCENGRCNVTACQTPIGKNRLLHADRPWPQYYNLTMKAWYCKICAMDIQEFADLSDLVLFEELAKVKPKTQLDELSERLLQRSDSYQRLTAIIDCKKACMVRCDFISKSRLSKAVKKIRYQVEYKRRDEVLAVIEGVV